MVLTVMMMMIVNIFSDLVVDDGFDCHDYDDADYHGITEVLDCALL
jgi:hypothetical protein